MGDNGLLALALALYSEGKAEDRCMFAAESDLTAKSGHVSWHE